MALWDRRDGSYAATYATEISYTTNTYKIRCHMIYSHISIINKETLHVVCCNLQLKITSESQLLQMRELLHS